MDHAIKSLRAHGLWLTPSELGRPLYERRGFCVIAGVERWARDGKVLTSSTCRDSRSRHDHRRRREWLGESPARLLKHLVVNGEVCSGGASAALLQVPGPLRVLGTWLKAIGDDDVAAGLSAAVATTAAGTEIVTNVVRSAALGAHLKQAGFRWQGYNAFGPRRHGPRGFFPDHLAGKSWQHGGNPYVVSSL